MVAADSPAALQTEPRGHTVQVPCPGYEKVPTPHNVGLLAPCEQLEPPGQVVQLGNTDRTFTSFSKPSDCVLVTFA